MDCLLEHIRQQYKQDFNGYTNAQHISQKSEKRDPTQLILISSTNGQAQYQSVLPHTSTRTREDGASELEKKFLYGMCYQAVAHREMAFKEMLGKSNHQ